MTKPIRFTRGLTRTEEQIKALVEETRAVGIHRGSPLSIGSLRAGHQEALWRVQRDISRQFWPKDVVPGKFIRPGQQHEWRVAPNVVSEYWMLAYRDLQPEDYWHYDILGWWEYNNPSTPPPAGAPNKLISDTSALIKAAGSYYSSSLSTPKTAGGNEFILVYYWEPPAGFTEAKVSPGRHQYFGYMEDTYWMSQQIPAPGYSTYMLHKQMWIGNATHWDYKKVYTIAADPEIDPEDYDYYLFWFTPLVTPRLYDSDTCEWFDSGDYYEKEYYGWMAKYDRQKVRVDLRYHPWADVAELSAGSDQDRWEWCDWATGIDYYLTTGGVGWRVTHLNTAIPCFVTDKKFALIVDCDLDEPQAFPDWPYEWADVSGWSVAMAQWYPPHNPDLDGGYWYYKEGGVASGDNCGLYSSLGWGLSSCVLPIFFAIVGVVPK